MNRQSLLPVSGARVHSRTGLRCILAPDWGIFHPKDKQLTDRQPAREPTPNELQDDLKNNPPAPTPTVTPAPAPTVTPTTGN